MRPIFTVHAGEYLVASKIESLFPKNLVWIPSKDTGIDLLVTDNFSKNPVSIQVKFSKDHLASGNNPKATKEIKSGGWWTFNPEKIANSPADLWVLVLCNFETRNYDYLIISPDELSKRYKLLSTNPKNIQSYFWVTHEGKCWETRGLKPGNFKEICNGKFSHEIRDFSRFLNQWPFENN